MQACLKLTLTRQCAQQQDACKKNGFLHVSAVSTNVNRVVAIQKQYLDNEKNRQLIIGYKKTPSPKGRRG